MSARFGIEALRSCGAVAVVLSALLLATGCTPASTSDVRATAQRFQAAVRDQHLDAACGMLSDEARSSLEDTSARSCAAALRALNLSAGRPTTVEVWGNNAQARLPDGALFLAEFRSGWKVTGAGCRPRPDRPYSCSVRA